MSNPVQFNEKKIPEDLFHEMRKQNLLRWPTGKDVHFEDAVKRQKELPNNKRLDLVMRRAVLENRCLVQPRGGFGTFDQHKNLMKVIDEEGLADIVPTTTDSYTRNEQFALAQKGIEESEKMMNVYADFVQNFMAIPVIKGLKTATERFAGAEETYCIEALMQDGKALQAGTSHFLGQNFAKAFDVKFANKEGKQEYVWGTSWGVSTRLMGALVMTHSDDKGLVLPPNLAPIQVVIVPIYKTDEQFGVISEQVNTLSAELRKLGISVKYDNRDTQKPGFKFAEWELKGVPVRIAVGPNDLENGTYEIARRDNLSKEVVSKDGVAVYIQNLLTTIQNDLFAKALDYRDAHITEVNSFEEFKEVLETKGGFLAAHWDGTPETEEKIKELTKATIRCIALDRVEEAGACIFTGKPSTGRVLFAKAY